MNSIPFSCASLAAALMILMWPAAPIAQGTQAEPREQSADGPYLLALADGTTLWGRIAGHDAERVTFERLDTGGVARVPWSRLHPQQASNLLEQFGYVDHSGDELMVEADLLTLADGNEVIGKIINRTPTEIHVKTATRILPVPLLRLRGAVTTVQVPALDVYTREELYRSEASKLIKDDAASQFELARYCERIYDFAHAFAHYQAAQAADPAYKQDDLKAALTRSQAKAANQEQLDFLYKIDSMRARGQYDRALAACDEFDQKYEESPLRGDCQKRRTSVKKAREQALRDLVANSAYKWAERLAAAKGRNDPPMTLEASLAYIEDGLKNDLQAAVLKDAQRAVGASVQAEDVHKAWVTRKEGRFRRASYGIGTWLLGEKAAQAGLEPEKKDTAPKSEADKERAKLEEKLKRYLDNQQIVKKKNAGSEGEESEQEVFWREWNSFARGQWLLAYYVEHGADLVLKKVSFSACADCNGEGVRDVIHTGSARSDSDEGGRGRSSGGQGANSASSQFITCPLCHGVRVKRQVSFW